MDNIIDNIVSLMWRYAEAIEERPAWSGKEFACDYMHDICTDMLNLLTTIHENMWGTSHHYPSDPLLGLFGQATHHIGRNHRELLQKIVPNSIEGVSLNEIYFLWDIIDKDFLVALNEGEEALSQYYTRETGKDLADVIVTH